MDKLIIIKKQPKGNGAIWKPVMVKSETYEKIDALAKDLDIPKGELATKMLEYALRNIELKEEAEENGY